MFSVNTKSLFEWRAGLAGAWIFLMPATGLAPGSGLQKSHYKELSVDRHNLTWYQAANTPYCSKALVVDWIYSWCWHSAGRLKNADWKHSWYWHSSGRLKNADTGLAVTVGLRTVRYRYGCNLYLYVRIIPTSKIAHRSLTSRFFMTILVVTKHLECEPPRPPLSGVGCGMGEEVYKKGRNSMNSTLLGRHSIIWRFICSFFMWLSVSTDNCSNYR